MEDAIADLPESPTVKEWSTFKKRVKAIARTLRPPPPIKPDQLQPDALRQRLEQDAIMAKIPADVARELPGPLLSAWVRGFRARALITQLRPNAELLPTSDQEEIMSLLEDYWSSLFTYRPVSSSTMASTLRHTSWPSLLRPITQEEVAKALAKPKPGSSPGPDGLPYEFYRSFPSLLPKLTAVLNHCYQHAAIPAS